MDKLTESRAVVAPKRRVRSDTLMTDSLTLEPPIVARLSVTRRVPRSRSPSRLHPAWRCSMRRPLAVFITLCLASTLDAAPAPRKEALVKQAVLLTDPQDVRMTEAMFRAYEEQFTEQQL